MTDVKKVKGASVAPVGSTALPSPVASVIEVRTTKGAAVGASGVAK